MELSTVVCVHFDCPAVLLLDLTTVHSYDAPRLSIRDGCDIIVWIEVGIGTIYLSRYASAVSDGVLDDGWRNTLALHSIEGMPAVLTASDFTWGIGGVLWIKPSEVPPF